MIRDTVRHWLGKRERRFVSALAVAAILCGVTAGLIPSLEAPQEAQAGSSCVQDGNWVTCTYTYATLDPIGEYALTLPSDVDRVYVTAIGAAGDPGGRGVAWDPEIFGDSICDIFSQAPGGAGGLGARVATADDSPLVVGYGATLYITVAGAASPDRGTGGVGTAAPQLFCPDDNFGGDGGSGGGASYVQLCSRFDTACPAHGSVDDPRIVVAAGGGGGGGAGSCGLCGGAAGGSAGFAGASQDAIVAGGAAGVTPNGIGGAGGDAFDGLGEVGGGGGGGGGFKGGAGGSGGSLGGAAGGGGGSNLVPAGGTATLTTETPMVQIRYFTVPTIDVTVTGVQTYGSSSPTFSYEASPPPGVTVIGAVTCHSVLVGGQSVAIGPGLGAGSYPIDGTSCSGLIFLDATVVFSYAGTLRVDPKLLVITASSTSVTYGQPAPEIAPIYSGFVNGDSPASLTAAPSCYGFQDSSFGPLPYFPGVWAGEYPTVCVGASAANYLVVNGAFGTLTVLPAPLTITASSATITFGDAAPAITPIYSGFVAGDIAPPPGLIPIDCAANYTQGEPAGTYVTHCSGASFINYTITYQEGTLTVLIAGQSITFDLSTLSKTYGDASFDISGYASASSGLPVSFESATPAVCTLSGSMVTLIAAGTCTIDASQAGNGGYEPAPGVRQSFTVARAPLSVDANDATMTYSGAPPTFDALATGLVNGDTFSELGGRCEARVDGNPVTSATPPGTYLDAITCSAVDAANYIVTYTTGTLTVDPAILTVTPDNQSAQYSDPLPALTASISGYVLGEGQDVLSGSLSCTTTAEVSATGQVLSGAGTYTISCSGLAAENYEISYQPATLTVVQEDAAVRLARSNPRSVAVESPGTRGSAAPELTFSARIAEADDNAFGDISLAMPVTLTLEPVGGGGSLSGECVMTAVQPGADGVPGHADVVCTRPAGTPVDVYEVVISVGGSHFHGTDVGVLTVYDPSDGGANGSGVIIDPATGQVADVSFSASYLKNGKNVQGKFLYVSRDADGNVVNILKGNVMSAMAIVGNSVKITGKATLNGVGNYSYVLVGVDEDTGTDRYSQQVKDPSDSVVDDLSFGLLNLDEGTIFVAS